MKQPKLVGRKLLSMLLALLMLVSALPASAFAAEKGQFALLAVDAGEQLIEPCYVSYRSGDTVADALKKSGHTFDGIDQGFITAIDGHAAPYSLHYDGNGYDLTAPAAEVQTALWFTTNSQQEYGKDLLALVDTMARYNTAKNGVKDYASARSAYQDAVRGFYQADDRQARTLGKALTDAMARYDAYLQGKTVPVTLSATLDGKAVTPQRADFVGEYGNKVSVRNTRTVNLIPGRYDYVLTQDGFRHVRGSITVTGAATVKAAFPAGQWVKDVTTGIDSYWKVYGEMRRSDVTAAGATFYIPDFASGDLYTCLVPADDTIPDTYSVYAPGSSSNRGWNSQASVSKDVYPSRSLEGASFDYEIRAKSGADSAYQTFTMDLVRTPSLQDLSVRSDGTRLTMDFDRSTMDYALTTTSDSVDVTALPLCQEASVTINGVPAAGESTHVALRDCKRTDSGKFTLPIVVTAPNGQATTYTLTITQLAAVTVTVKHETGVDVEILSASGSRIAPQTTGDSADTYRLIPGADYTWLATRQEFFHATAAFTAAAGQTIPAATPHTGTVLQDLCAKPSNSAAAPAYPMTPAFQAGTHRYEVSVESNSTSLWLSAPVTSDSTYTVTAFYPQHRNGPQPGAEFSRQFSNTTSPQSLSNFMAVGGWGNQLRLEIAEKTVQGGVTYYQDYFLTARRQMTINDLKVSDNTGVQLPLTQQGTDPAVDKYSKLVTDYTVKVGQGVPSLTLSVKPLSSNREDHDCTVAVTCGDWQQTLVYNAGNAPSTAQELQVPLNTKSLSETITLTVAHADPSAQATTYTLAIAKLPPVPTTFTVVPADASIFLTDNVTHAQMLPGRDGAYILNTGAEYTWNITKPGYVGQTLTFLAGKDTQTQTVRLVKAPASTHTDIAQEGDWPQFRGEIDNNGVVEARTPIRAEDTTLVWANRIGTSWSNAVGCPIIVGGDLYAYSGKEILKISAETGEILLRKPMAGASSFAINSPTYGGGMIFVALSNGGVQAFDAVTLDSLWVYHDPLKGQCNCPIAYANGCVYTGFWNSETKEANFICLTATDEDPSQPQETKLATWTHPGKGFYWAGAYVNQRFLLVTTDDGASGYTTGHGDLMSLDPMTGAVIEQLTMPGVGDLRSSVCYDESRDAYYFTSKGGDFYEIRVNTDGTFVKNSLRQLHLDNGTTDSNTPPMSTSTPVVYNGRAYIGVSGASQFGSYGGHNMTVIDLDSFSVAYTVPTAGYPQTSGLLTTAYEESDGYVYVYFVDNMTPGVVRVLRDKPGMTAPDPTYMTQVTVPSGDTETTVDAGYVLFTPTEGQAQYAICSPISDNQGNLYFKNDSGYMMRLSSTIDHLEVTRQPQHTTYHAGQTFDPTGMEVTAHYANGAERDITPYLGYSTEPLTLDDTEITVSYDLMKLLQNQPEEGQKPVSYWNLYQDRDSVPGTPYDLPTATVAVEIQEVPTAQITLSLEQDNFYPVLPHRTAVRADLSDRYGYTDQVTDAVSALDALIAVHQELFGDAFTPETRDEVLMVNESGFITKMMGEETSSVGFAVNGRMPNDGVLNEAIGSYTGLSVNQTQLSRDDVVQFFFYNPAGQYGEIYTNFLLDGQHITALETAAGLEQKLQVQGYSYMYEGCHPELRWKNVPGIQVCLLQTQGDQAGTLTPIEGAVTDENGVVRVTFPAPGTYTLAVTSDSKHLTYILPQLCTVTVHKASADERAAIAVNDMIGAIGPVHPDKAQAVADARQAYDDLTDAQRLLVTRIDILEAAEAILAEYQQNKAAAQRVDDQILAIGPVTLARKDAIEAARQAYDHLTDAQRQMVTQLDKLQQAEEALAQAMIPVAKLSVKTTGKPYLTWQPVEGAHLYQVYCSIDGGDFQQIFETEGTRMTNSTAMPGEARTYTVRAITARGTKGQFCQPVTAICTLAAPSVTISARASDGAPVLTWAKQEHVTGYVVYVSQKENGPYSELITAHGTKVTHSSAQPGRTYYYKVRAINTEFEQMNSVESAVVHASVKAALEAPAARLSIVSSTGKPRLRWDAVDGAVEYQVYRATSKNGAFKLFFTTDGTRMTNSSAKVGHTYYYKVRAVAADGSKSPFSATKYMTCDCARPTVKISLRSDGSPVLTWKPVTGATGYEVYRATSRDGSYTKLITAHGTKVTHSSAKAGRTYYYKVRAMADNRYATGAYSQIVSIRAK